MTSAFRLLIALVFAGLAFAAGLSAGENVTSQPPRDDLSSAAAFELRGSDEVRSYVGRISAAGLFPDADIAQGQGQSASGALSVDEIEMALSDTQLAALVSEGGEWTVLLFADNGQISRLRIADELQGGWLVSDISSVTVLLRRGDETREVPVFPTLDE